MKSYHKNVKKKTLRECTRGRTYYFEGPFVTLHAPMSSVVVDFQPIVVAYIGKKKQQQLHQTLSRRITMHYVW